MTVNLICLDQISQLQNSIQERPVELQLTVLKQSCERQQPSQRQQRWKTRSQASKELEFDSVDAKKSECQVSMWQLFLIYHYIEYV